MTAHPKICPTTGELHFFGYGSIFTPHVTYHRADASGELTVNRGVEVPALTMMHDFALTAEHVIFMDLPIVFNLDIALRAKREMPYRWDDNYGARLGVMRRDDPFGEIRWFEIDPCYVFHVANAYGDGNYVVLQAVRYPELWRHNGGFEVDGVLWRWRSDFGTGTVEEGQLDDRSVEFPRIDDRLAGLPARYSIAVGDGNLINMTWKPVRHRNIGLTESRAKPSSCHRHQAPASAPAGIWRMCMTRFARAATWLSSTLPTLAANPLHACGFRSVYRTASTATGSPTDTPLAWRCESAPVGLPDRRRRGGLRWRNCRYIPGRCGRRRRTQPRQLTPVPLGQHRGQYVLRRGARRWWR